MAGTVPAASAVVAREAPSADEESTPWPEGATAVAIEKPPLGDPPAGEPARSEAPTGPLPALDVMVNRIPPAVREALDDLFRVKFTGVTRVTERELK